MFYHFCQAEAFNFVRCDKISNFCSIRRTFFKKALAFSSEKCYLVSNKSGSRIQRLRRALHLPALGFILLIIMLFSSFTFLSFTLSRKGRKKRLPNLHGEALFSVFRFLFKDRPYSIQPLRQCEALTERLYEESLLNFLKRPSYLSRKIQRPQRTDGAAAAQLHSAGHTRFDGRSRFGVAAPHTDVLRQRLGGHGAGGVGRHCHELLCQRQQQATLKMQQ